MNDGPRARDDRFDYLGRAELLGIK